MSLTPKFAFPNSNYENNEDDEIDEAKLQNSRGTNWHENNMRTIFSWICISAFQIEALDLSIRYYREIIRKSVFLSLVFSTASGTLSITRFGFTIDPSISYIFNGLFTFMSFCIAIVTGSIKIYQIQEKLEEFIRIKQEWILFGTTLASELQLPTKLRKDALYLIISNKTKYLDLLKIDCEIPESIKVNVKNKIVKISEERGYELESYEALKISDIIMETSYNERYKLYQYHQLKNAMKADDANENMKFEKITKELEELKKNDKINALEKEIDSLKNDNDLFIYTLKKYLLNQNDDTQIPIKTPLNTPNSQSSSYKKDITISIDDINLAYEKLYGNESHDINEEFKANIV